MKKITLLAVLVALAGCFDSATKKQFKKELSESCIGVADASDQGKVKACKCVAGKMADRLSDKEMGVLLDGTADLELQQKVAAMTILIVPDCVN